MLASFLNVHMEKGIRQLYSKQLKNEIGKGVGT